MVPPSAPFDADDEVVELCSQLVRFDTTNYGGGKAEGERDAAEWVAGLLTDAGLDPVVLESAPRRGNVVVRVPGTDPGADALLVHAHLDVVPAHAADWSVPPFGGEVRDGVLWGRGSVDMKDMIAMVLNVLRRWHRHGRSPHRDIVFAFVADEEDTGALGARWLVTEHPELFEGCVAAISETGGFSYPVSGVRFYPVATAERGTAWMKITARGTAGHGSRRNPDNAVLHLAAALSRLGEYQWPVRLTPTVRAYLEGVGTALGLETDLADVDGLISELGGAARLVESTVRNSSAVTVLQAGHKINVVPGEAVGYVDGRVLPGTEEEFFATVDSLLGPAVRREFVSHQAGVEAPVAGPWFQAMAAALRHEDPDGVVLPYCMGGGTDAKSFARLGIACYGFSPLRVPDDFDYYSMAHGVDERVPVEGLSFGARVLDRFLSTC